MTNKKGVDPADSTSRTRNCTHSSAGVGGRSHDNDSVLYNVVVGLIFESIHTQYCNDCNALTRMGHYVPASKLSYEPEIMYKFAHF